MGFYNTAVGLEGGKPLYCPPEKVGRRHFALPIAASG
jgi:hypothetical protein